MVKSYFRFNRSVRNFYFLVAVFKLSAIVLFVSHVLNGDARYVNRLREFDQTSARPLPPQQFRRGLFDRQVRHARSGSLCPAGTTSSNSASIGASRGNWVWVIRAISSSSDKAASIARCAVFDGSAMVAVRGLPWPLSRSESAALSRSLFSAKGSFMTLTIV